MTEHVWKYKIKTDAGVIGPDMGLCRSDSGLDALAPCIHEEWPRVAEICR